MAPIEIAAGCLAADTAPPSPGFPGDGKGQNVRLLHLVFPSPPAPQVFARFTEAEIQVLHLLVSQFLLRRPRVGGCLSAGCYYKMLSTAGLRQQTFVSHSSGDLRVLADSVLGEGSFPGLLTAAFLLCAHVVFPAPTPWRELSLLLSL